MWKGRGSGTYSSRVKLLSSPGMSSRSMANVDGLQDEKQVGGSPGQGAPGTKSGEAVAHVSLC